MMKSESGDELASGRSDALATASSPDSASGINARRSLWSLRFLDPALEARFLQETHEKNVPWILGSLVLGLLMMAAFYTIDRKLIPTELLPAVLRIRFLHMVPLGLLAVVLVMAVRRASIVIPVLSVLFVLFGTGWTRVLLIGDTDVAMYASAAMSQTVLFAYVCLGLPFRWAAGVVAAMVGLMAVAIGVLDMTDLVGTHVVATLGAIVVIATFGAYRYEWSVRDRFIGELRYRAEYDLRLASEQDRSQWLGTIAGFVRHELKNAMAGIGSSLQLVNRSADPRSAEIIGRAERSLQFMRNVLQQVGDATNLETALQRQDSEPLSFSDLVAGRLQDHREQSPQAVIDEQLQPGLYVNGNADSLVQMLDKLVNNALEHATPGSAITIALRAQAGWMQLEVSNRGDALPENLERLFQPFVSTKAGSRDGNLGLGLYVAKVIAAHHGGEIAAEPLRGLTGARFVVRLPQLERTGNTVIRGTP